MRFKSPIVLQNSARSCGERCLLPLLTGGGIADISQHYRVSGALFLTMRALGKIMRGLGRSIICKGLDSRLRRLHIRLRVLEMGQICSNAGASVFAMR